MRTKGSTTNTGKTLGLIQVLPKGSVLYSELTSARVHSFAAVKGARVSCKRILSISDINGEPILKYLTKIVIL